MLHRLALWHWLDRHFHTRTGSPSPASSSAPSRGFIQIYRTASRYLKDDSEPMNQTTVSTSIANLTHRRRLSRTIWSALRLVAIASPLAYRCSGGSWAGRSAALLAVGALISGSGLFEWLRLMTALMARMDATARTRPDQAPGPVLIGFFLRLGVAVALLYVSLKFLHGSVYALAGGLALGVALALD